MYAALTATTEAVYCGRGPLRVERILTANRCLTVLRILLRGARDRHYLSVAQHEYVMERVDDWGRQLGGWLKAERGRKA